MEDLCFSGYFGKSEPFVMEIKDAKLVAQTNELVQKVEELISNLGVPLGKLPATPEEAEKIKMAVEERRNPKPSTSHTTQAQPANPTRPKPKATQADKAKRRIEDEDGFILPAKHLVAKGTRAVTTPVQISSNTNTFISTNPHQQWLTTKSRLSN
ncbi:hypothetical protein CEXT_7521 [Caerostris extrusa]|uniref:Uncharacterized protein n=1 Tax=Caerostris extrusa TaxID=172846 RepID=A0AAV4W3F4_CAEEX|nr:hypothetical protein CEXT_7521 [Caerostris extrusa]